jgi:hypothetical protein
VVPNAAIHPRRQVHLLRVPGLASRESLGALTPVPDVRSHRLQRLFSESARQEAFPYESAPDHPVPRAARGLALVLYPTKWKSKEGKDGVYLRARDHVRRAEQCARDPKRRYKKMTTENEKHVRAFYDALIPGHRERVMSLQSSRVVYELPEGMPTGGGRFEGIMDVMERFLANFYAAFDVRFVAEDFITADD